jgi:hypothetical protein
MKIRTNDTFLCLGSLSLSLSLSLPMAMEPRLIESCEPYRQTAR